MWCGKSFGEKTYILILKVGGPSDINPDGEANAAHQTNSVMVVDSASVAIVE